MDKADHLLGYLVHRDMMIHQNEVKSAGCTMPQPLIQSVVLKVQTTGAISPDVAFRKSLHDLSAKFRQIQQLLSTAMAEKSDGVSGGKGL